MTSVCLYASVGATGLWAAAASTAVSMTPRVILGSGSSTRRTILNELGVTFEVFKPDIDEKSIRRDDPADLVLTLGRAKAAALLEGPHAAEFKSSGAWLLTADQVVVCNGCILEKPEDAAQARMYIQGYGSAPAETVGSCVLTDTLTGQQWAEVDFAKVFFSPLEEHTIDQLISQGEIFYCAGGLMVEHPLVSPHVSRVEGELDTIMGLRKATVLRLFEQADAARANAEDGVV